jgi:hypothetical protein
LIIKRIE